MSLIEKLEDEEFTRFIAKVISALALLITFAIGVGLIVLGSSLNDSEITNTGLGIIFIGLPVEGICILVTFYDFKIVFEKDEK